MATIRKVRACLLGLGLLVLCHLGMAVLAPAQEKTKAIALGDPAWRRPTILDTMEELPQLVDPGKITKSWVDKALAQRGDSAVIPGFQPAAVGNLILYRTYNDV